MKRLTLEEATKDEIIQAIKSEFALSDVRKRLEREATNIRVQALLREMDEACRAMERHRQKGPKFDAAASRRWSAANSRWNRANARLSDIQGV